MFAWIRWSVHLWPGRAGCAIKCDQRRPGLSSRWCPSRPWSGGITTEQAGDAGQAPGAETEAHSGATRQPHQQTQCWPVKLGAHADRAQWFGGGNTSATQCGLEIELVRKARGGKAESITSVCPRQPTSEFTQHLTDPRHSGDDSGYCRAAIRGIAGVAGFLGPTGPLSRFTGRGARQFGEAGLQHLVPLVTPALELVSRGWQVGQGIQGEVVLQFVGCHRGAGPL